MGDKSKIDWTDATVNWAYGCTKVSPACANCYAVGTVRRLTDLGHMDLLPAILGADRNWTGQVVLKPERMAQALHWRKPRLVFVNSLSDTFHESIPDEVIGRWWDVMARASQHTFQILTKRPERAAQLVPTFAERHTSLDGSTWPLKNVWVGTTVEDQDAFNARVEHLLAVPAAVHFLSMEPLLGPVNLRKNVRPHRDGRPLWPCSEHALDFLDWVIVGGESGPNARPMHPEWVRDLRDQCQATGTPFFFKQWGEWRPATADECFSGNMTTVWNQKDHPWLNEARRAPQPKTTCVHWGAHVYRSMIEHPDTYGWQVPVLRVGKKAAGHLLDGVEHHAWPDGVDR